MRALLDLAQAKRVRVMEADAARLDGIARGGRHQGVAARVEADSRAADLDELLVGLTEPPLLLVRLVGYVRDAGKRCGIYTNGFALTKERIDSLTDAGLTTLVISLNAVTQEQHEAVMGVKDKFDYVCHG